ncbi:MAG: CPBP family intramembrane metalloprotease [Anaerolineae bacterium]|nr:CPBP family intramembrane metalloprotease [Anaerolineae bacterium]
MSMMGIRHLLRRIFIKDEKLHPLWRASFYVIAYVVVTLSIQLAVLTAYMFYQLLMGMSPAEVEQTLLGGPSPSALEFVLLILEFAVVLGLTYVFRHFLDRESFASLGFRRHRWVLDAVFGLLLGFVLMAGIFFAEWGAGLLTIERTVWDADSVATAVSNLALSLLFFIIAGTHEEIVFRGYLIPNLREGIGVVAAVIVSSLVFGVFHALNPNVSLVALLNIALAGVVFAYAYLLSGNLWLPIAFHFSWNFFQGAVFSLPVSGIMVRGILVTHPRPGADLITGGAFGPEGGLSGFAAMAVACIFLWLWSRAIASADSPAPSGSNPVEG